MITDGLIGVIVAILRPLFNILPVATLGLFGDVTTLAGTIGSKLKPWNGLFPVVELVAIAVILATVWLPALVVYVGANWVWRHIPDVGGFGPGSG